MTRQKELNKKIVFLEPLLTLVEVAQILKANPKTIRRYCKSGKIDASIICGAYKISLSSLQKYCDSQGIQIVNIVNEQDLVVIKKESNDAT